MEHLIPLLLLCAGARSQPLSLADLRRSAHAHAKEHGDLAHTPLTFAAVSLHGPVPILHIISSEPMAGLSRPTRDSYLPQDSYQPQQDSQQDYQPQETYHSVREVPRPTRLQFGSRIPQRESRPTRPPRYRAPEYESAEEYDTRYSSSEHYAPTAERQKYARPYQYHEYEEPRYSPPPPPPSYYEPEENYRNQVEEYQEPAPTILYARPNKSGGYTYRKRQNKRWRKEKPREKQGKAPKEEPLLLKIHKYIKIKDR